MDSSEHRELQAGLAAIEAGQYAQAFALLLPRAEGGDAAAQCNIAALYHVGNGVEADGRKAVEWYRKAAKQEIHGEKSMSVLAYHNLGTLYSVGAPGVPRAMSLAKENWRKSLMLGSKLVPPEWLE